MVKRSFSQPLFFKLEKAEVDLCLHHGSRGKRLTDTLCTCVYYALVNCKTECMTPGNGASLSVIFQCAMTLIWVINLTHHCYTSDTLPTNLLTHHFLKRTHNIRKKWCIIAHTPCMQAAKCRTKSYWLQPRWSLLETHWVLKSHKYLNFKLETF